jgi:hypothetical protein
MLDEPLTGLDAAIARQVKDLLTQRGHGAGAAAGRARSPRSIVALMVTALINLWHPMPGNRRHAAPPLAIQNHGPHRAPDAMLWAIATVLAVVGSAWALVPIGLANAVLLLCSPPRRKLERALVR